MPRLFAPILLVTLLFVGPTWATTLVPMTEDEQIRSAQMIFRGRAERVDSVMEVSTGGRSIFTTVRFTRLVTYKGTPPNSVSLRFLGGKVGDLELTVDGMPRFRMGGEYVLFVSGEKNRACPVVGWSDGSLPVERGTNAAGEVFVPVKGPGVAAGSGLQARSRGILPVNTALPEFERRLRDRIAELSDQP